jgi:hypothetical protein
VAVFCEPEEEAVALCDERAVDAGWIGHVVCLIAVGARTWWGSRGE